MGVLQLYDKYNWKLVVPKNVGSSFTTNRPIMSVEYFFIVIPLTLLSAWLLLSKVHTTQTIEAPPKPAPQK
jgi:hypothetical protein